MSDPVIRDLFGAPVQQEPPRPKTSLFDVLTKLALPVVLVLIAQLQGQRTRFWVLISFAGVSFFAGFYSELAVWFKRRRQASRDERIVRQAFPGLKKFIQRFGDFVGSQSDTLHYVVQSEVCGNNPDMATRLGLPSRDIFQGFWTTVSDRAASENPSLANFRGTASLLNMLVALYNNHCMYVVFERLPQELRAQASGLPKHVEEQVDWARMGRRPPSELAESARRSLEGCRERFNTFFDDYEKFLGEFEESFAQRYLPIRGFPRSKPL